MYNGSDLDWMGKALRGSILLMLGVGIVGGIALWEFGKWLLSHIHIWWK